MTTLQVYHGGNTISRHEGFRASHKPGRSIMGTGLYCTVRHYVAERYTSGANALHGLVLDIDETRNAGIIKVSFEDALQMIRTLPVRNQKEWAVLTEQRKARCLDCVTLSQVEVFVVNYTVRPHVHMQNLNDFFLQHNAQFSLDAGIIRVHNFDCITSIVRNPSGTFEGSEKVLADIRANMYQNAQTA